MAGGAVVGRARVILEGDTRKFNRDMAQAERQVSRTSRVMGSAMKAGALALGVGLAAAAAGAWKATQATSNLGEQISKTNVVFGKSAKEVQAFAKTTAQAFGISNRAALEAAGTFGNMLVPMGFARQEAGKMSVKLVGLAADMASFNNASPEATLDALRAGLAGETEPLRRFGVFLNDARLKQQAMTMGLYKGKGALDAQTKAAATYALILKDTKDTQGDFGRTSSSLANQQRILKARIEDMAAAFGRVLIPVASKVTGALNGIFDVIGKIAAAPNVQVAISVAGEGLRNLGSRIKDGVQASVAGTNWKAVGTSIGAAIGSAITITGNALDRVLGDVLGWVDSHAVQIGEIGAEITARIALTLTDPIFWAHHLDLLVLLLALVLGKGVGRVSLTMLKVLSSVFGRGMLRLGGEAALLFMRGVARLPSALGDAIAAGVSLADNALRPLVRIVGRVLGFMFDEFRKIPGLLGKVFRFGVIATFFRLLLGAVDKLMGVLSSFFGVLGHLPGKFGAPFRAAQRSIDGARERIRDLKSEMTGLKPRTATVNVRFTAGGLARGVAPGRPDGVVGVGQWYQGAINAAADGAFSAGLFSWPGAGGGGAGAGGLKPMILDDLALGRSMGLSLSSGYRPGAITSSGNPSLHGAGQAIDMHGSHMQMSMYAQAEAGRSGIAEVIYSPLGWWHPGAGWGPITDAEIKRGHYSHVHVGARSGDGLIGDGMKGKKKKPPPDAVARRVRAAQANRGFAAARAKTELPAAIRLALSKARASKDTPALIAALQRAAAWYRQQLVVATTDDQRSSLIDSLSGVTDEIDQLKAEPGAADATAEPTVEFPTTLSAELELAIFDAEDTPGTGDDVAAHQSAIDWLSGQLAIAPGAAEKLALKRQIREHKEAIKAVKDAEVEAKLEFERQATSFVASYLSIGRTFGSNITPIGGPGLPAGQTDPTVDRSGGVIVVQNFNKPPDDPHPLLQSAKFAAENVLG